MTMTTTVTCPKCNQPFELSDALRHELEDKVKAAHETAFNVKLSKLKEDMAKEQNDTLTLLREENAQKEKQLVQARQAELDLRKQKNQLEDERRSFELEKQRQLDRERDKIREQTVQEYSEKQRLKDRETELKIESLKKALEDAQRKASQGSQQLQGEAQEIDIEMLLRSTFSDDDIQPVGKGILGADIRQEVRSPRRVLCGSILWESKRTKAWSDSWIAKLKQDMIADKAHVAAIVTDALPPEAENGIGVRDGVWVCSIRYIVPLATLLRKAILDAARQRIVSEQRQTSADKLYSFVTSHEFQQRVESMIGTYMTMREQVTKERAASERSWKLREQQIDHLLTGVAGLYGSMQGIAGSALPTIKSLEFAAPDEE